MIEFKLFFALISYYFVMFVTPGPNNAMLTASGIKFGFKKTIPLMLGVIFGFTFMVWKHFLNNKMMPKVKGKDSKSILLHGGGWK